MQQYLSTSKPRVRGVQPSRLVYTMESSCPLLIYCGFPPTLYRGNNAGFLARFKLLCGKPVRPAWPARGICWAPLAPQTGGEEKTIKSATVPRCNRKDRLPYIRMRALPKFPEAGSPVYESSDGGSLTSFLLVLMLVLLHP